MSAGHPAAARSTAPIASPSELSDAAGSGDEDEQPARVSALTTTRPAAAKPLLRVMRMVLLGIGGADGTVVL